MSQEVTLEIPDPPPTDPPPKSPAKHGKCLRCVKSSLKCTLGVLGVTFFVLLYILYATAAWLICNKDVSDDDDKNAPKHPVAPPRFYQKARQVQETTKKLAKLPNLIHTRIFIILVVWLIVNLKIPSLRHKPVLETELWKWTLLVVLITCGYHVINMVTLFVLCCLCSSSSFTKKPNGVYFAKGMRRSLNFLVLSTTLLLTWVFYFRTSRGIKRNEDTDVVLHVGTWSFVTFAVAAVLWALKTVLLLKWEADAVYRRFRGRIFISGSLFYFLGHICGWPDLRIFRPGEDKDEDSDEDHRENNTKEEQASAELGGVVENPEKEQIVSTERRSTTTDDHDQRKDKKIRDLERKEAKDILCIGKDATLYDIKKMTNYFINLSRVSSREDDGTSDILDQCRKINPNDDSDICLTEEDLCSKFELEKNDANILYSKLKDEHSSSQISYKDFEKFMVKTHNNCVALGHTLLDAREVVKVLNQVMTGLLIAIVFISWLLLTDIATTKILVLIASPILAVTFVFGDTCKKIFEGIIFSFINHPFDVGDRCIIGNTELEVKRLSVLSTKFLVIGTKEEAFYPNSTLASMLIINLKGEPDPSDNVELILDSKHSKSTLDALHNKITNLFEEDNGNKFEKASAIVVKEIGGSVKMEIQFEHVMSIHEATHSQCLRKKRKQKSELFLKLKQFIDEIDGGNGSSSSASIQENKLIES